MRNSDDMRAQWPEIATSLELDRLKADRSRPKAELHHTPEGFEVETVRTVRQREQRIGALEAKFEAMRERLGSDHRFAALQGRARTEFERSR